MTLINVEHNHPVMTEVRKYGALKALKLRQSAIKRDNSGGGDGEFIVGDDDYMDDMRVERLDPDMVVP